MHEGTQIHLLAEPVRAVSHFDSGATKKPAVKGAAGSNFHTEKTGEHQARRASKKPRKAGNKTHKYVTEYESSRSDKHRTKAGRMKLADVPWETRNRRSVWTAAPKAFREAHFATFPPDLVEPCILAGCSAGGIVIDPFGGAGTTGLVADAHGRNATLIELNPAYVKIATRRISGGGIVASAAAQPSPETEQACNAQRELFESV
jgi:DNA modification methylase